MDAKNFVKNSFSGPKGGDQKTDKKPPTIGQVAKARAIKPKKNEKGAYMSSDILSAYNKFRTIEKKAEVEKQKRLEVQVRSKYDVEITDASDFN